jgi:hypothetical protein
MLKTQAERRAMLVTPPALREWIVLREGDSNGTMNRGASHQSDSSPDQAHF